jgi:hypothetical protein
VGGIEFTRCPSCGNVSVTSASSILCSLMLNFFIFQIGQFIRRLLQLTFSGGGLSYIAQLVAYVRVRCAILICWIESEIGTAAQATWTPAMPFDAHPGIIIINGVVVPSSLVLACWQ